MVNPNLGDDSWGFNRWFTMHTHMTGVSSYEIGWRAFIRLQHLWKKYSGGYERDALEYQAKLEHENKIAQAEKILAEKSGESDPNNWQEKVKDSQWKLNWVPDPKRSPPAFHPLGEKPTGLTKVKGLDLDCPAEKYIYE